MTNTTLKVKFAPGCFDNFEGTQEELDDLIKEIYRLAENGELLENASEISVSESLDAEDTKTKRVLQ